MKPTDVLIHHALQTLPQSMSERKQVLRAMEHLMTDSHPFVRDVRAQLASLAGLERLQSQLLLKLHAARGETS